MRNFVAVALLLLPLLTHAQDDSLKTYALQEVIITGEIEPQSVEQSVYNVRTIPMERLQWRGATRLQDVLNTELNIRFSQDAAVGGSNISMMGLPGQNVKVLIDGVPVIGRQGVGNEININQLNAASIERVEIVEGPMAVIYGADALAGVINIITKKSSEEKLSLSATVQDESAGDEYSLSKGLHSQNLQVGSSMNKFYFLGSLNHNKFGGWTGDSTGREKTWHPKNQWMGGGTFGFRNDKLNAYYRADYLHEKIYNPAQFIGNEAIDKNYFTQRLMHQVQLTNRFSDRLNFNTALSYTSFESRTQSIAVNKQTGRETLASSDLQTRDEFTGMTFRGALHYQLSDAVSIQPGWDVNTETGLGTRLKGGKNTVSDFAGFVSADITLGSLSLRPGLRLVRNSVYDAPPLIPALNTKLKLNSRHDLRLSYGRGFRAPSLRELYFNFFDASHSIEGNTNLQAELSHSVNVSWNARLLESEYWRLRSVVSVFYNDVENLIDYGVKSGSTVTTYINVHKFKSQGVTANATLRNNHAEFRLGFAYTGRYNQFMGTDQELPDFAWSPEVNSSVTYHFDERTTATLFYKYTGKTPLYVLDGEEVILTETAGYHWADLSAMRSFGERFSVTAGVRNLFNVTAIRSTTIGSAHSSSGGARPVGYGRSFFVNLSYRFIKS